MKLIDDRYELEDLPLARGGMGDVWIGRDRRLDREIVVKFLRFPNGVHDESLVRRFDRESRITARLEHPGVPAVHDVGVHEGRPYLVMQRVHGITVADLIAEQGHLPVGWAVVIAAQVCAVLTAAHAAGLVHRDLKPGNLMLEPDGSVKVLDFGLAVAPALADYSKITHTHQSLGTPAYMAPEQVEAGTSEARTDLYALGCTLYEMLTGKRVFDAATSFSVMMKQVKETPPALRSVRSDAPAALEGLLLELLEKRPENRPDGADVVYRRLLPFATGLGPLPGALHPADTLSPARLYSEVLSRIPKNPSGVPAETIDPDMLLFSRHLATAIMSPEWRQVIRHADPAASELLHDLAVRDLPVPIADLELDGTPARAMLAWPERRAAILPPSRPGVAWTADRAERFIAAGWDARPLEVWTAEGLVRRLTA